MQRFDKFVLLVTFLGLVQWVTFPDQQLTAFSLLAMAMLQLARLLRWKGINTLAEPLITILHVGYGFVALGALAIALDILFPDTAGLASAQHLWMAGGIGVMTMAVMTRATLGHTGQTLTSGRATNLIFAALIGAVVARYFSGLFVEATQALQYLSALLWVCAFGGFAVAFGPLLMRPRP